MPGRRRRRSHHDDDDDDDGCVALESATWGIGYWSFFSGFGFEGWVGVLVIGVGVGCNVRGEYCLIPLVERELIGVCLGRIDRVFGGAEVGLILYFGWD